MLTVHPEVQLLGNMTTEQQSQFDESFLSPLGAIIFYILLAIEILVFFGFWQLVRTGVLDSSLANCRFFSQLTVGLFDDGEIVVNSEDNSAMEGLPSVKLDPKDMSLHTCEDTDTEKRKEALEITQMVTGNDGAPIKSLILKTVENVNDSPHARVEKKAKSTNSSTTQQESNTERGGGGNAVGKSENPF
ncbi:hypothetical protein M3Y94_01276200 [Aphelenchoides besseyi]|nr:hypothetical protein M3Y94_01276200 [Aphelenchoides besseyi]KAI6222682.1 hypothetical protein M3Y95_00919600 [Aphelenchoides besseyi]